VSFIRVEKKPSGTYIRILESYRKEDGKPSHRILHNLGKVEDYSPAELRSIGIKLYELGGGQLKSFLKGEIVELDRFNYGYKQVYKKALSHYGLLAAIDRINRKSKITFSLFDCVLLMLLERLHEPCSKLKSYHQQNEYLQLPKVELHHIYRSLDVLAKYSEVLQHQIYQTGRNLFNSKLDVVFYDVTTFYFQSAVEKEGQLRQMGFGKDGKIGKTQILFSMMIDKDKNPIGYQVFKGDTFEGHTFEQALETLKSKYNIDKVIVVADRGMLSKNNLEKTVSRGYDYIIGERLKSLPSEAKLYFTQKSNYIKQWVYLDNMKDKIAVDYTTLEIGDKTVICTYSEKRAKKDKHDRLERIEKAKRLLKTPSKLKNKAYRYFLKVDNKEQYQIDDQKIADAEKYDGLIAISTNTILEPTKILEQYKQLYKIEQSFRTFKSHLEVRPMFHWTDKRIEGHICLCYIALTIQNWVINKVNKNGHRITEQSLRKTLDAMQVSEIQNNGNNFYIRSKQTSTQTTIQKALGLRALPPMFPTSRKL